MLSAMLKASQLQQSPEQILPPDRRRAGRRGGGRGEPFAFYSRPYPPAPKNAWESTPNPLDDFQFNEILERAVFYTEQPLSE
jgi:hypothetical protein